ncbi:MAG: sialidase family protein [Candidatus Dormibacteria bacterium]
MTRRKQGLSRRSGLLAFACVTVAVVLAGCGSALTTPIVSSSVAVTSTTPLLRQNEVPVMLADKNVANRAYMFNADVLNGKCQFFVSNDSGYTWRATSAPQLQPYTNCGPGSSQPLNWRSTMVQGPDGAIYVGYAAHDPSAGGSRSALLGKSTDGGNSWKTVAVDAAPPASAGSPAEIDFEPHIAVDPNNAQKVVVLFRRSYPSSKIHPTRAYIATSTDGGATFSPPTLLFDRSMGFDPPYPVIANNTLYISWHETFSSGPDKIWFSSSTDGGKTFSDHQVATGTNVDTPVLLYDSGRKKWNMFWDAGDKDLDVLYSSSTDGSSWSSPKRLNDDPKSDGRDQELPAVSISPNGRIDVAFYDYRNDPYPIPQNGDIGNRQDVYYTFSTDGGSNWSANVKLNDLQIDRMKGIWNTQYFIQVPPAIASTDTWAVSAWSDTRNGDEQNPSQDIYAAAIAFDASTIAAGRAGASSGYSGGDVALLAIIVGLAALLAGSGITLILVRRRSTSTSDRTAGVS